MSMETEGWPAFQADRSSLIIAAQELGPPPSLPSGLQSVTPSGHFPHLPTNACSQLLPLWTWTLGGRTLSCHSQVHLLWREAVYWGPESLPQQDWGDFCWDPKMCGLTTRLKGQPSWRCMTVINRAIALAAELEGTITDREMVAIFWTVHRWQTPMWTCPGRNGDRSGLRTAWLSLDCMA